MSVIDAMLWYGKKCATASGLLQRAFVTSKWVLGLSSIGAGMVLWLTACASWSSFFTVLLIQAAITGISFNALRWCWEGAQTDRPDAELLPEEAHECTLNACAWTMSVWVVSPAILLLLVFSGEPRLLTLALGPVLYSFGWWAMVGPGLPPSAREPASSPVETPA